MLANLKWSDTDNFYMNLGCHKGVGLVVCGDDKVEINMLSVKVGHMIFYGILIWFIPETNN